MSKFVLQAGEIQAIRAILADLASDYDSVEDPHFQTQAELSAHELPRRLRRAVHEFRLFEPRGAMLVVSGLPIDDAKIGPTPSHWKWEEHRARTKEEEMFLVLLGSLLGECIGWSTQQAGRIVHDILPIKEHEGEQLGSGSEQPLWWHTEDAFHECRGDYLGMACLRNPDRVPTTFTALEGIDLTPEQLDLLFAPHFTIRPDESHLKKNKSDFTEVNGSLEAAYGEIERMNTRPDKIAVLFGDRKAPYMRIDPYFMDPVEDCPKAQEALDALIEAIDARLEDLVLEPGQFFLLDNFQAVHGRRPFKARYDGTDRWMKRINVVRDLRKSRGMRPSADCRLIG